MLPFIVLFEPLRWLLRWTEPLETLYIHYLLAGVLDRSQSVINSAENLQTYISPALIDFLCYLNVQSSGSLSLWLTTSKHCFASRGLFSLFFIRTNFLFSFLCKMPFKNLFRLSKKKDKSGEGKKLCEQYFHLVTCRIINLRMMIDCSPPNY